MSLPQAVDNDLNLLPIVQIRGLSLCEPYRTLSSPILSNHYHTNTGKEHDVADVHKWHWFEAAGDNRT